MPDQYTQKLLVRIKGLFSKVETMLWKTEPSKFADEVDLVTSVQLLDYVVEMTLKLILSTGGSKPEKNIKFPELWNSADTRSISVSSLSLPLKRDLNDLHDLRNNVQHQATIPHPDEVRRFIPLVQTFLQDVYKNVFSVDFDTLSRLDLLRDQAIKLQLKNAYEALSSEHWIWAVKEAAVAYRMLSDNADQVLHQPHPFAFYHLLSMSLEKLFPGQDDDNKSARDVLYKTIIRLQEQIFILSVSGDFMEYRILSRRIPDVSFDEDMGYEAYVQELDDETIERMTAQGYETVEEHGQIYMRRNDEYGQATRLYPKHFYTPDDAMRIVRFVEDLALKFQSIGIYDELSKQIPEDKRWF